MKAIEILQSHYPKLTEKLREKFPKLLLTAEKVEVIPWREEFAVADVNPEVIDEIEFWRTLHASGLITEEELVEKLRRIKKNASKTMGIAFIEEKQVSFRAPVPDKYTLLHEIGHVHFQVNDSAWNSVYGGGEILLWLGIEGKYRIGEEEIRRYHEYYQRAQNGEHLEVAEEIVEKVAPLYGEQIVPAFYPICLYTGWMPEGVLTHEIDPFDLKNERWLEVEPLREDVVLFFINLTEGLKYKDSFWIEYAKRLGVVR